MTEVDGVQPVVVPVGACRCTGTPHDPAGDEVYLAPEASLSLGLAASGAMAEGDTSELAVLLGRAFLRHGIVGWTFTAEDGSAIPVTPANIERLLPWARGGSAVAERADELYGAAILAPLLARSTNSSRRGPTAVSTSAIRPSRAQRRNSSKSSSPARSGTMP